MIRLIIRITLLMIAILLFFIPFCITSTFKLHYANRSLARVGFRIGCILSGLHVKTEGAVTAKAPLLVVSNHFSYLDVFALGSVMKLCFTPKSEVASWPVVGFFCKVTGCIFIDRRPSQTGNNKAHLDDAIQAQDAISLFPEGTTNDGTMLLPFKSSFFSIAEHRDLPVQPVSIVYTQLNGEPVTMHNKDIIGWYADMEFIPHVATLLKQRSFHVLLTFHPPVNGKNFSSRKELAGYCYNVISGSLAHYPSSLPPAPSHYA